jgi:hypothetical protein
MPLSLPVLRDLFNCLGAINLCPCRELEVVSLKCCWPTLLMNATAYVQKDLAHYREQGEPLRN